MPTPSSSEEHPRPAPRQAGHAPRRARRRVTRRSDAESIDRSVDSVRFYQRVTAGAGQPSPADRVVPLDEEQPPAEDSSSANADTGHLTAEFWRENQPPHYGHEL